MCGHEKKANRLIREVEKKLKRREGEKPEKKVPRKKFHPNGDLKDSI